VLEPKASRIVDDALVDRGVRFVGGSVPYLEKLTLSLRASAKPAA